MDVTNSLAAPEEDDEAHRAVVLLSGGLDSTTVLALAIAAGYDVHALTFRYGQRHALELRFASIQAHQYGVTSHEVIDVSDFGRLVAHATALVGQSDLPVPKDRDIAATTDVPVTYVPARNALFLAYALAWAEALEARSICLGVNVLDYSGYPDCRPAFVQAFEHMANLATRSGVESKPIRVRAPLLELRKHEIIAIGLAHGVNYRNTLSCYDPTLRGDDVFACGRCDSCRLRLAGFQLANSTDPANYLARR